MKPIAYYAVFVDSLIMIYDIEYGIEDYVIYTYKTPSKESRKIRAKIRYDKAGNAYFREKDPRAIGLVHEILKDNSPYNRGNFSCL